MDAIERLQYLRVIDEIARFPWETLTSRDMTSVAWGYYYCSVQFRENLEIARALYPHDEKLRQLHDEECNTDNLSPWPGVAAAGERMNHDEFMRRTLAIMPIEADRQAHFVAAGQAYLATIRQLDPVARALSIVSYEDGGLEKVFTAMLRFQLWDNALLQSFEHFLAEHVRFDSDPTQGHGALCRHLPPDDRVMPFWEAFRHILVTCAPALLR